MKVLRNSNGRWTGLLIILFGLTPYFMIDDAELNIFKYGLPFIFTLWGLKRLSTTSVHKLWLENKELYWSSQEGESIDSGSVNVDQIKKVILEKKGTSGGNMGIQWNEVRIITDNKETILPRGLNFGGTGNPKIDDMVNALKTINSSIGFEMIDSIDRQYIN